MELNVDFTELNLAAAKMKGLDAYLLAIREAKKRVRGRTRFSEAIRDGQRRNHG